MNCIAVDDEPLALNVMKEFCAKVDYLNLVACCTNAVDAAKELNKQQIDLMFLDIHMPNISGLEFIKTLQNPPLTIFTTAYSEHALEGFEVNAIDYLVKPIPFDRFFKAVNKAHEIYQLKNSKSIEETDNISADDYILIKVEYQTLRVNLLDILYVEGVKDYVKIVTTQKSFLTKSTMKNIEERLPSSIFVRIHKSYIISLKHMMQIENNRIVYDKNRIPIGEQYKEKFLDLISNKRI